MNKRINTVIVGGGQSGLSISYYLKKEKREHVILEKNKVGESWRSRKWDSFTLVTPNHQMRLPGFTYHGNDPDGFMTRREVINYFDRYVALFNPPLRLGVEAISIEKMNNESEFRVITSAGTLEAINVVITAGTFQKPKIPDFSQHISPDIFQLHSSLYRNPDNLPDGAVLVVGSGQSGSQIAEELQQHGRKVYLSTGSAVGVPRRYRGKDFTWWLTEMKIIDNTVDTLSSPKERFSANPRVSGKDGGHSLNLHRMAKDGMILLGRTIGANGVKVELKDDLMDNLRKSDKFETEFKNGVDNFIEKSGLNVPKEDSKEPRDGYSSEIITELNLENSGITSIIWATGYDFDFSWIKLPVFDEFGYPKQQRGVTSQPGLYFLGLHWLHTIKSGLFFGVGDDAKYITDHIAKHS